MEPTDLVTVVIRMDGGSDSSRSPVAGSKSEEESTTFTQAAASAVKAAKKLVAVGTPLYFAKKIATNRLNTVSLQYGATEYEQRLQTVVDGVDTALQLTGSSILAAAAGGPWAVVGTLAAFGISKVIDIAEGYRQLEIKENNEEITQSMQQRRMGNLSSTNGRRTWR